MVAMMGGELAAASGQVSDESLLNNTLGQLRRCLGRRASCWGHCQGLLLTLVAESPAENHAQSRVGGDSASSVVSFFKASSLKFHSTFPVFPMAYLRRRLHSQGQARWVGGKWPSSFLPSPLYPVYGGTREPAPASVDALYGVDGGG